jgi:hypothetical protein
MGTQVKLAMKAHHSQRGIAFMVLVFMIALASTIFLLKAYDPAGLRIQQAKKTEQSLAAAKQALLAYAAEQITPEKRKPPFLSCDAEDKNNDGIIDSYDAPYKYPKNCNCGSNCPRPGDMPCPDMDNDGVAENSCSTNQIGRFPWKTLGADDLRDGAGERLWYAVSSQYKNNPRLLPLNSDSVGTISLRDSQGNWLYDASGTTGLAAVVIAPGEVLTRSDGLVQSRTTANQNSAKHYLDIAYSEDNASFTEGSTDGFISGLVNISGQKVVNDVVLPITRDEVIAVMEPRVLAEAMQAMSYFYATNGYYPDPANISEISCLGSGNILNDATNANCITDSTVTFGRMPAGSSATLPSNDIWSSIDSNSILRGDSSNNWFQQNGWRELILYAVAPACTSTTPNCSGTGYLTLNNSTTPLAAPSPNNKQMVLIASGKMLTTQTRTSNIDKTSFSNYLEDLENLNLNYIYNRHVIDANNNDRLISTP